MVNLYGPKRVSTDEYLKIVLKQELNRKIATIRRELLIAVGQEYHGRTIRTGTDLYQLILNSLSLCSKSVIASILLHTKWEAARHFYTLF
jgi:hypothetical protein